MNQAKVVQLSWVSPEESYADPQTQMPFFPSHQTMSEPLQPNYASAQDLVFVLNEVQCFLLTNSC